MNLASLPFREIWACDFEYRAAAGERVSPVCFCAQELRSGRQVRAWRNELLAMSQAPFDVGPDSVIVAYAAQAELACFLELGWHLPTHTIDLFAEHRVETNGLTLLTDNKLAGALALRGLAHMDAGEKADMQQRFVNWTDADWALPGRQQEGLDYCFTDVAAAAALLHAMPVNLPFALLRGRFCAAVARMERAGIPIDVELYRQVIENWDALKGDLIGAVDASFGVYEDGHFRAARFERWLAAHGITNWPRTEVAGTLCLDSETFDDQVALHAELPELQALRELRATLGRMRLIGLTIGTDGRNRCALMPFQAITGRNLPSGNKFLFGPARWMRGFLRPPEGYGLAYLDYASQEIGIAAALSGDERLAEHYATGDPYWRFAVTARLASPDATVVPEIRDLCKSLFLALGYGMQALSLARRIGRSPAEARELIQLHTETYPAFARWRTDSVDRALLSGRMHTAFDWRRRGCQRAPIPELLNWPVQSTGADVMRCVCIAAVEAGIEVVAPVHDGFVIIAPLAELDRDVERMRALMLRASEVVTGGPSIRVDAKVKRWPDRYMDKRGRAMWNQIMGLLKNRASLAA